MPLTLSALLILLSAPGDTAARHAPPPVRPGIEVLVEDSLTLLRGKRVGFLGNHTAVDRAGRRDVDRLRAAGVRVLALFSPEHGFQGSAAEGAHIASSTDSATGLPIYSLYGRSVAPRRAWLDSLDVVLIDMQDAGARYYTYISTALEMMKVAGPAGVPVMILDRPNPIGGTMQGNVLPLSERAFIGSVGVPMRHGLTMGELARIGALEHGLPAPRVIPVAGWHPTQYYDETGLTLLPPSPNLRRLEALIHYPGTCLFEATNLSVGRGTDVGFEQFGAGWLDRAAVLAALPPLARRGVAFDTVSFTPRKPSDGRSADTLSRGFRLRVTDRAAYDPVLTAVGLMQAIRAVHGERFVIFPKQLDRLAGGPALRQWLAEGVPLETIAERWAVERHAFADRARAVWVYPR